MSSIIYSTVLGLVVAAVYTSAAASDQSISHQAMAQANLGQTPVWSATTSYGTPVLSNTSSSFQLPKLGVNSVGFSEERTNRAIAQWSLQQVNASLPQVHDPWVVDFIYCISAPMNAQVRSQSLLAVPVIKDNGINAFAVTGGLIAINTGTILAAGSLDEVASVLAHEIAHLSQRHYEHTKDSKGKMLAISLGGLLAAIAASSVSGDAAATVLLGAQTMAADTAAAHSREHEREADRVGMQILAQAGYDARAMPQFFERLQRQISLNQSQDVFVPSFMRSHPLTQERLSDARSRADGYALVATQRHQAQFELLKWRIAYLSNQADLTALSAAAKHSTGAKLALIAKLADERQFAEAQTWWNQVEALPVSERQDPLFAITKAHIAYEQGDFKAAAKLLAQSHTIYPERRDVRIYLADSLIYANQAEEALPLLLPLVARHDHDVVAWDLLQRAYTAQSADKNAQATTKTHAQARALQARAKKELWRGQYDKALSSLTQAKTLVAGDVILTNSLDDDLAKVRQFKELKL